MRSFKTLLKILRTVLVFLLIVAVLSAGLGAIYLRGECQLYQDVAERDSLSGKITLLGCGASYMFFGFRPDVLERSYDAVSYNLSGLRLSMEGRYELLRLELERNPIRTVLLEVSSDTLTRSRAADGVEGDLQLLGRLTGKDRLRYFRRNFTLSEYPSVYYDIISKGTDGAVRLLKGTYQTRNTYLIRGYYKNVQSGIYISQWFRSYYHTESLSEDIREENIDGLRRIAALCREHGAELILIETPKTESYNSKYDNHEFFRSWFSDFAEEEGISYYDFNLYRWKFGLLPDQDCFGDDTHLNDLGAERFSEYLAQFLTERDAGEDMSYYFFSTYAVRDEVFGYVS